MTLGGVVVVRSLLDALQDEHFYLIIIDILGFLFGKSDLRKIKNKLDYPSDNFLGDFGGAENLEFICEVAPLGCSVLSR